MNLSLSNIHLSLLPQIKLQLSQETTEFLKEIRSHVVALDFAQVDSVLEQSQFNIQLLEMTTSFEKFVS